jgi:release factor glutamine methyltransferase
MTVREASAAAVRLLEENGFPADDARADVSVLARHILRWTLTDWAAKSGETVSPRFANQLFELVRRRARHEPVAYITGVKEFYGRPFKVTRDVLIPRPETEGIVEAALTPVDSNARTTPVDSMIVIDVGTGSGCLAITLGLEWPEARVMATDTSEAALQVARENARSLGATNVEFLHTAFWPDVLAPVDLIVSNPPYVPESYRHQLEADVRDFEPAAALFASGDGLDVIREIVRRAPGSLRPGGRLIMEIGIGQSPDVSAVIRAAGLELLEIRPDLQGIPRTVIARRQR